MNSESAALPKPAGSFALGSPARLILFLSLLAMAVIVVAWPVENTSSLGGSVISHWRNALFELRELRYRPAQGIVRSLHGEAYILGEDGQWSRLKVGARIKAGAVLRTRSQAQVYLYLDQNGPVVRLSEDSLLEISTLKYRYRRNYEMVTRTELVLRQGHAVGVVRKPTPDSVYLVTTPQGQTKVDRAFNLTVGETRAPVLPEAETVSNGEVSL